MVPMICRGGKAWARDSWECGPGSPEGGEPDLPPRASIGTAFEGSNKIGRGKKRGGRGPTQTQSDSSLRVLGLGDKRGLVIRGDSRGRLEARTEAESHDLELNASKI